MTNRTTDTLQPLLETYRWQPGETRLSPANLARLELVVAFLRKPVVGPGPDDPVDDDGEGSR